MVWHPPAQRGALSLSKVKGGERRIAETFSWLQMSRITHSGSCRAEAERTGCGHVQVTQHHEFSQAGKTSPQHPPEVGRVQDQSEDILEQPDRYKHPQVRKTTSLCYITEKKAGLNRPPHQHENPILLPIAALSHSQDAGCRSLRFHLFM